MCIYLEGNEVLECFSQTRITVIEGREYKCLNMVGVIPILDTERHAIQLDTLATEEYTERLELASVSCPSDSCVQPLPHQFAYSGTVVLVQNTIVHDLYLPRSQLQIKAMYNEICSHLFA